MIFVWSYPSWHLCLWWYVWADIFSSSSQNIFGECLETFHMYRRISLLSLSKCLPSHVQKKLTSLRCCMFPPHEVLQDELIIKTMHTPHLQLGCYAWLGYIWFPSWVFRHVKPVCVKTRLSKITFLPIDNSEKFGDIRYADIVALIFYVWLCCFWWQFSIQCIAYFPKYMPACLRFVYLMTIIK